MADHPKYEEGLADLEMLFASARDSAPMLSDELTAAMVADAANIQGEFVQKVVLLNPAPPRMGMLSYLTAALGGWTSVGGLLAASCTGLWFGIAAPDTLLTSPSLGGLILSDQSDDYSLYQSLDLVGILAEDMQ